MVIKDRIGNELRENDPVMIRLNDPHHLIGRIVQVQTGKTVRLVIAVPINLERAANNEVVFGECVKVADPESAAYAEEIVRQVKAEAN